jgi:hypothetical protein
MLTGLRPNQTNLFELEEAYGYALWLAWDAAAD